MKRGLDLVGLKVNETLTSFETHHTVSVLKQQEEILVGDKETMHFQTDGIVSAC
jgi:hypothetical protein